MSEFICFGHRGASGHEPENTLRSIRRALEMGANGVEIDVWAVGGELLVIHDGTLQRTTNGRGPLSRKSLEELRALDAGAGERIPTLREVFETVGQRALINIELKGKRTAAPVCALIQEFVDRHGWSLDSFLVSSFHRSELKAVTHTGIRIGVLNTKPTPLYYLAAKRLRAWSIHSAAAHTSARFVENAHKRGYKVFVYTVNSPELFRKMRKFGVDGIFTDFPDRFAFAARAEI